MENNNFASKNTEHKRNLLEPQYQDPLAKREQFAVSLRKAKTKALIDSKRKRMLQSSTFSNAEQEYTSLFKGNSGLLEESLRAIAPEFDDEKFSEIDKIQYLLNQILYKDNQHYTKYQGLAVIHAIRTTISLSEDMQTLKILEETQLLDLLTKVFMFEEECDLDKQMKIEASWILANLAVAGVQELDLVLDSKYGILQYIQNVLDGADRYQITNVLWFLANLLATHEKYYQWVVHNTNALDKVFNQIVPAMKQDRSLLKIICWFTANYTIHCQQFNNETEMQQVIAILKFCLGLKDRELAWDSLQGLTKLMEAIESDSMQIKQICQGQSFIEIIEYTNDGNLKLKSAAIKLLGLIVSLNNDPLFTKKLLELELLDKLIPSVQSRNQPLIREVMWIVSNIVCENLAVNEFCSSELFMLLLQLTKHENVNIRNEAIKIFTNAIYSSQRAEVYLIMMTGLQHLMEAFVIGLKSNSADFIIDTLEALVKLFQISRDHAIQEQEQFIDWFQFANGLDAFEELLKHPNIEVSELTDKILQEFFMDETDDIPRQVDSVMKHEKVVASTASYHI